MDAPCLRELSRCGTASSNDGHQERRGAPLGGSEGHKGHLSLGTVMAGPARPWGATGPRKDEVA
jgi:hypothetical protein